MFLQFSSDSNCADSCNLHVSERQHFVSSVTMDVLLDMALPAQKNVGQKPK